MLIGVGRASDRPARSGSEQCAAAGTADSLTFQVKPVPPFRLDLTVQALRRRTINAVDRWDGTTYCRILVDDQRPLGIEVVQIAPSKRPMLQVTVRGSSLPPSTRFVVMSALSRLLSVDRCLDDFYRAAADDPGLGHLARLFRGLKPPRFPTLFEALINAFACQQVTLSLGIQLLNRLAETCARGWDVPGDRAYAFPSPDDLAGRKPDELRALGFSRQKGQAIIELACAVAERRFDLDELEDLDDEAAVARLRTCAVWAAGPRSTRCCGGWGACTCSRATTSAPATTCNAGSGSWNRSTTTGCGGPAPDGSSSRASSTCTSCCEA